MGDIIVSAVIGVMVGFIIRSMVKEHKNGGGCAGCSGNCSQCARKRK